VKTEGRMKFYENMKEESIYERARHVSLRLSASSNYLSLIAGRRAGQEERQKRYGESEEE